MAFLEIRIAAGLLLSLAIAGCSSASQPAQGEPAPAASPAAPQAAPASAPAAAPQAVPATPVGAVEPAQPVPAAAKPTAAPSPLCEELCRRTAPLGCGPVELCTNGCNEMAQSDICAAQLKTMLACIAAQPVKSFECDAETHAPAIREGHCGEEQSAVADCISGIEAPAEP